MNFKSRRFPALEVLDVDGTPCVSFDKRMKEERVYQKDAPKKPVGKYLNVKA
tara:strand:- start:376 stop:531 length:156 start_codon:yes stop_codon:yes gene_type:complete